MQTPNWNNNSKKETHKEKRGRIRARRLYWLRKIKQSKGCENCGYNEHPLALDFAHRDQRTKHAGAIYGAGSGMSKLYPKIYADQKRNREAIRNLFKEVRKCKILCKNCHVIETYNDKQFENNWQIANEREGG